MTNKEQIIIDGVDVSECRSFDKESYTLGVYDCDLNELHGYCYCNNDCHFKQLARKTQECEQIKEKYEALKLENQEGYEIVAELKHECEELKKEKAEIKKYLGISYKTIMQRLEELTEYKLKRQLEYIKIQEENDRYRKALQEIEEYAKENDDMLQGYHHEWANNKQILEIINKAKGEE